MLVPHGSGRPRAVEVSRGGLRVLVALVGVLAFGSLGLSAVGMVRGVNLGRSHALEHENAILLDELGRVHERLLALGDTISRFGEREQELRLLAGLTPPDSSAAEAGIGGPRGAWRERDSLVALGSTGEWALAARLDVDALMRRASILVRSLDEAYDSLIAHRDRMAATPSIMPTRGWITSAFAAERFHPLLHLARPHEGIDITAPLGAAIEAPASGIVSLVSWEEGYGNVLTVDHGNGLVTRYAHCARILVGRGQRVKRGQTIALVGSTGLSTGPHLHYEVWLNGKPVDPLTYVLPDAIVD